MSTERLVPVMVRLPRQVVELLEAMRQRMMAERHGVAVSQAAVARYFLDLGIAAWRDKSEPVLRLGDAGRVGGDG